MFSIIDKFYGRSSGWRSVRNEHIENNPTCAACGRRDGLEVHHIVPYHVDPSKELDPYKSYHTMRQALSFCFWTLDGLEKLE